AARAALSQSDLAVAEIQLLEAKTAVSIAVLTTLSQHISNIESLENAKAIVRAAIDLQIAVSKQVEIGEAPKVHATRAELEVLRATQAVVQATAKVAESEANLVSLTAEKYTSALKWISLTNSKEVTSAASYQLRISQANAVGAQARIREARAQGRPTFSAGLASDVWSLDRSMIRSDNLGLQFSFRVPLFKRGQSENIIRAAEAEAERATSLIVEARRLADLNLETALSNLNAARTIVSTYSGDILPKGEQMLASMREGYRSGLVTLIEVLEAQQALGRMKQEKIHAEAEHRLAELAVMKATLNIPGMEVTR
ncbi:MAG TPA: TolC family protein, partial [Fimbriimonas sp.]|nr:TolC family protein [Fimbriimonas sp.]